MHYGQAVTQSVQQDGGRKMKQLIITVLACFAVFATPVRAEKVVGYYGTYGKDLLQNCDDFIKKRATVNDSGGFCQGFVEGAIDTYNIGAVDQEIKLRAGQPIKNLPLQLCIPNTVYLSQAIRVVKKYLEDHPEKLH